MVTLSELYPSGSGGGITYPINSVRSPFSNADFFGWWERGKNFANNNRFNDAQIWNETPITDGQTPSFRFTSGFLTQLTGSDTYRFTQDRAISLWLYKQAVGNDYQGILCKDNTSPGGREWNLTYINDGGPLQGKAAFAVWGSSNTIIARASADLTENTWQHWLLNYDHATTTWTLYRDGSLQDTQVMSGIYNSSSTAVVMGNFSHGGTSLSMQGFISQAIFANRKFTSGEIALLYGSGAGYFTI